jgi:hypothetical protein
VSAAAGLFPLCVCVEIKSCSSLRPKGLMSSGGAIVFYVLSPRFWRPFNQGLLGEPLLGKDSLVSYYSCLVS